MGNIPSTVVEGEESFENEEERTNQRQGVTVTEEGHVVNDFSVLFDTDRLLKALVNVKDVDTNGVNEKKGDIEQWLKNMTKRGETSVTDVEFIDFANTKGVKKEDAQKFFDELDPDQQGSVEITFLLHVLKDRRGPSMSDALLLTCSYIPGALDSYLIDTSTSTSDNLGLEIIKFLRRYRVDPLNLAPHTLSQLVGLFQSREQLINGQYCIMETKQIEGLEGMAVDDEDGKVTVSKCYSSITCSTGESSVFKLTDGSFDSYWQSNGSPRSHWIRIQMLPGVRLKELAVAVNSSDDSYMPKLMTVSVGNSSSNLKQLKSVSIPRDLTGRIVLMGALSVEYTYIQIQIRQCHSDGCDTRVRQVDIKGYKQQKGEDFPTVLDGLVMWYLGLIASVSKAAMPIAPTLRDTLMGQTKTALKHFPPLSLSRSSPLKPEFLTPVILKEMESFIKSLCVPGDNFVSLDAESLSVLLEFSISVGDINTILDCLLYLLDNISLSLPVCGMLKKLVAIEQKKYCSHTRALALEFVKSDSKSEDGFPIENIFTNGTARSPVPFKGLKDMKVVNAIAKETDLFVPVKLGVKIPTTDAGISAVLVFGIESETDVDSEDFIAGYSKYDTFTLKEWETMKERVKNREIEQYEDGLLTYMELGKDSKEFEEIRFESVKPLKYFLFKFIGQESAERMSILSVRVRGHQTTSQQVEIANTLQEVEKSIPSPVESPLVCYEGGDLLVRLLVFLCRMLYDRSLIESNSKGSFDIDSLQESHVVVDNFSLEKVWNLYIPLTLSESDGSRCLSDSALLCLILIRNGVQFLKPPSSPETKKKSESKAEEDVASEGTGVAEEGVVSDNSSSVASAVLSHLCSLVDSSDSLPITQNLAKDIIRKGVLVFFPGSKARKKYLLDMVGMVLGGDQPASWWLKFEALCSYFSQKDNNSLLELNWDIKKIDNIVVDDTLSVLTTVITVATEQAIGDLGSKVTTRQDDLVKLLCAMQSSLLFWCKHLLQSSTSGSGDDKEEEKHTMIINGACQVLQKYTECLRDNCLSILKKVPNEEDKEMALKILKKSITGQALPQLVSFLSTFCSLSNLPFYSLLTSLQPLSSTINDVCSDFPSITLDLGSEELKRGNDDVVAVWTRESKHNYEDNCNLSEDFVFPSASRFVIEFDPRCHTERRYDYLTFTDTAGTKIQYDDNYSSDRWPTKGEFVGPKLTFDFHSDGSNNYWGYKFTIKAYGKSIPPLHWLYDLHVSLSRLFGQYVSSLISVQPVAIKSDKQDVKKEEEMLLKSDLWKTLFRAGLVVVSKQFTRSLSGAYEAISPKDTNLCSMLFEMAEGKEPSPLIEVCRSAKQLPSFGGPAVDRVIGSVFAALIWHSQEIRDELNNMMGSAPKATPNVLDAFTAAEALRRELVESRQKIIEAKEKEEDEEAKSKMDEDEPLTSCHNKAMFLLKFAGLTRVTYDTSRPSSPITSRPSWGQKSGRLQKSQSVVSTVGRIKQQISRETKPLSPIEKHPSFETVLSFVRNTGLTVANVETLLQERAELARKVSDGYTFAAEYLRRLSSSQIMPKIPVLTFLQHMLVHQRKFPRHYAMRVDGCGLELENKLRRSFQMFIHRLIDMIKMSSKQPPSSIGNDEGNSDGASMVKNVFSHIMDMSWQDYDLSLLKDLQLPDYLFESIIGSSTTEKQTLIEKFPDEDDMMVKYERYLKFMEEWNKVSRFSEFLNLEIAQENIREANLFVGAMTLNPTNNKRTMVNCDGCSTRVKGPWYRDVDINEDCDLCPTCFNNGTGSRPPSFSEDHILLHVGHHLCHGCGMGIVSHRFQRQTDKNNYCFGCFKKEGDESHWTAYLLTECPGTDKSNKFKSSSEEHSKPLNYCNGVLTELQGTSESILYNRQHNWLLFSSLTLMMANRLNQKDNTDPQYQRNACDLLLTCIQLIVHGLKFALSAEVENVKKKRELELKKKKEAEEKEKLEKEGETKAEEAKPEETKPEEEKDGSTDTTPTEEKPKEEHIDGSDNNGESMNTNDDQLPTPSIQAEGETVSTTLPDNDDNTVTVPAATEETDSVQYSNIQQSQTPLLQKQTAITTDTTLPSEPVEPPRDGITSSEKAFGLMYYESMLGLLATVLPKELSLLSWITVSGSVERIVGDIILPQLFKIARCTEMSSTHRLQSLTVAIKYMSRVSPEVSDHAIEVLEGVAIETGERKKSNGHKTLDYLFELGTSNLRDSNIPNTSSITECILLLSKSHEWKSAITQRIVESISNIVSPTSLPDTSSTLPNTTQLSVIFGLLLLAGFPKLPRVGSRVRWSKNNEECHGVIVTPVTDSQANVIEIETRKNRSLKISELTVDSGIDGCITESQLPVVFSIIKDTIPLASTESNSQVEYRWLLSLALKSLCVLLRTSGIKKSNVIGAILGEDMLPTIVKLACKPTHFSKQWKTSDLEILAISCYKLFEESSKTDQASKEPTEQVKKEKASEASSKPVNEDKLKKKPSSDSNSELEPKQDSTESESKHEPEVNGSESKHESEAAEADELELKHKSEAVELESKHDVEGDEPIHESDEPKSKPTGALNASADPDTHTKPDSETHAKPDPETHTKPDPEAHTKPDSQVSIPYVVDDQTVSVTEKPPKKESKEDSTASKEKSTKSKEELEEQAALRDLAEEIQAMLKIMKDAFQCSLAQVRAMYEKAEQDMDKFLMSSEKYYDSETSGLKLPDDIMEASRKWMPLHHASSIRGEDVEYQDDQEDTGVTGFMTVSIDLKNVEAKTESQSELKKSLELLPSSKESRKKQKEMSEKEISYKLLQDQLNELKDTLTSREMMLKIHRAQVILQAREVLTLLLLHWPLEAPKINSVLLGGLEMSHWFSLLDFLVKNLTLEERNKVLTKVVACSESNELVTLGLIAAQCMKEVTVNMERKEFKYQTNEKATYTGKIVMSSAACMKVEMEKKKTLFGKVELAGNEDFTEHLWSGSGSGGTKREDQQWNIPGNMVHYKVTLDKIEKSDEKKAWSMSVSGLQKGRFETSYSLLHILLGTPTIATPSCDKPPTLLPIIKLWPNLIAAACELTGEQRIKVIGILLQLLLWNSSAAQKNEVGGASSAASVQRLDLAMLKPLWSLYTTMSKDYDKGKEAFSLKPEILRALTELFLVVENTALDWRMEQDLLVETITEESLSQLLEKGISNVAYISLGLGLSNQVTEAFIEAKKNYVPPPSGVNPGSKKANEDDDGSDSNSSDSSTSSSSPTPTDSFDDDDDDDDDSDDPYY